MASAYSFPYLLHSHLGFQNPSKPNSIPFQFCSLKRKSPISASSSSSNPSSWEREEIRWLREEQRWLREEKRWLREESRWNLERESLLKEISALKLHIQALERQNSVQGGSISDTISNMASLLQVLKKVDSNLANKNSISESGSGPVPILLESEIEEVKEMVVKEVKGLESSREEEKKKVEKRASIRKGSEGNEVRTMQEALLKLGFYSGEEDMEYSSFSSGTERAVKTWQASLGAPEDGIMTSELLERLFIEEGLVDERPSTGADRRGNPVTAPEKDGANGASVTSVTEISEVQQTVVKESSATEVEVSHHRVFLLGENRWEEPSRLVGNDKASGTGIATMKCLTCRGEGRLLCSECDGTGEPNIEPQFLEWVDEGAKCPYCEGLGYTICDVCEGKTLIQT